MHDTRVALRRLREILVSLGPLLPRREARSADTRIRRALRLLGAVRDADVALSICTAHITAAASDPEREFLFRLVPGIETERTTAQEHLDTARLRIRKIRADVRGLARHLRGRSIADDAFLDRAILTARIALTREAGAAGGPTDAEGLHAIRLRTKHLRYLLESRESGTDADLAGLCVPLQRVLGEFHDVHLFACRIQRALADPAQAPRRGEADPLLHRIRSRLDTLHLQARAILADPRLAEARDTRTSPARS